MDIAEIRKRKKLPTRTVPILLDPDLRLRYDELSAELPKAQARDARVERGLGESDEATKIEAELDELEEQIRESTVEFVVQALPRAEWRELLEAAPPTPADIEEGLDHDAESLFAPLLAACAVEPELSLSDAEAIYEEWSETEVTRLYVGCIRVNREVRDVPFGKRGSERPSTSSAKSSTT